MTHRRVETQLRALLRDPALQDALPEIARNACAGGASLATAMISCAAYMENPLTGRPALLACMQRADALREDDSNRMEALLEPLPMPEQEIRPGAQLASYVPGFGFQTRTQALKVRERGRALLDQCGSERGWLLRAALSASCSHDTPAAGCTLNATGLAALTLSACGVPPIVAERAFLWWRMDPALATAQQAQAQGLSCVPFLEKQMKYTGSRPPRQSFDFDALAREIGLE